MESKLLCWTLVALVVSNAACGVPAGGPGLLFYLSGEQGTTADFSAGHTPLPTFDSNVSSIPDGAKGRALQCGDLQRLAYRAPGNIYAQRGTVSFFWRARTPVGPTPFPLFRVGYADHSSWDMVFLRMDYNGHGFDAFVTDASLSRTRVTVDLQPFPPPTAWIHLAFAWDETSGVQLYLNGRLAAEKAAKAVYNAALDQFGPHSRIISPYNVQSDYNFVRGGDIDELRIYDHALAAGEIAGLSRGSGLPAQSAPTRSLSQAAWADEWAVRYGWNRPEDLPPYYAGPEIAVRKVEIHDAYDLKRWWWKACDGIRETTWPGVYNRSRLPGRNDYFQLPDWDCYSLSGKTITFYLPNEPWNHLEVSGAAWGRFTFLRGEPAPGDPVLFRRAQGQEHTVNRVADHRGGRVQFDNDMQEQPIGEFAVYHVLAGAAPAGSASAAFRLTEAAAAAPSLQPLRRFIAGRFAADERSTLVGVLQGASPAGAGPAKATGADPVILSADEAARTNAHTLAEGAPTSPDVASHLPIVQILIPTESVDPIEGGLDGIVVELPALAVQPFAGGLFPLNIQVKDPLWPLRNLCDFTFSVHPGEAKKIWLDLRDRLLPPGRGIYLTIAGAGAEFSARALAGAEVRLVFKPRAAALAEHSLDRFTQMRDSYAMLVEEHPSGIKYDLWNRFETDLRDLIRVNPHYPEAQNYAAAAFHDYPNPPYTQPIPPSGVPLWAFRQVEALRRVERFANWWIDHRQVENGEYGGGLSDDTDLTNTWPGVALMGDHPKKFARSLAMELDACYRQGMLVNGLPAIQADELHSYEEGINCLGQNLIVNYGSPRMLERAMETARGFEWLTGVNAAGHRHIMSSYYNGLKMATDSVWGYAKAYSYLVMQPGQMLVDYNGNPRAKRIALEVADGLLAHRHKTENGRYVLPSAIHFSDDHDASATRAYFSWPLFWTSYQWTGDRKYLNPILDGGVASLLTVNANVLDLLQLRQSWGHRILEGRSAQGPRPEDDQRNGNLHANWQLTGDRGYLEKLYARQIKLMDRQRYIDTEGSLWIDRVNVPHTELQRARLGGIALVRNGTFPGHVVSWQFAAPASPLSVGILLPDATPTRFTVIAYNLDSVPVKAVMRGWNVDPGQWEITQGQEGAGEAGASRSVEFGRTQDIGITFAPRTTTVLKCVRTSAAIPNWERADLGMDPEDVQVHGREIKVRVHSLGSVAAPPTPLVFRAADGTVAAAETIPALAAPNDLFPRTAEVRLTLPAGVSAAGGAVEIDPDHALIQITRLNDVVRLP
jgi:hypothetical protein